MNVSVDISILCADGSAIGMVSGDLNLIGLPPEGALITFSEPNAGIEYVTIEGFSGRLQIKKLVFRPSAEREPSLLLVLEDITVNNVGDGQKIMKYLEDGFGLYPYEYD
jgi:hypothetical protein